MDAALKSLYYHSQLAALESQTLNISDFVKKSIPALISDVKSFFTTVNLNEDTPNLTSSQKDFVKLLQGHNYTDLAPLYVYVPEGLQASFLTYLDALGNAVAFASTVQTELVDYVAFISRLISHPDELKSTNYIKSRYEEINTELRLQNDAIEACFKRGSVSAQSKYGDVVVNNKEWDAVFVKITQVNEQLLHINKKDITKKIRDASELLDLLMKKTSRGELDNMTPEMVSKVADFTYAIARSLEFFSVVNFRVKVMTESVNQTVEKVMSVLK